MNVKINGVATEVADGASVAEVAAANGVGATGSAIAVNDKLVRRTDWEQTMLADGDDVVIIKAAYGG
jgi:sulfur carrier protein